MKGQKFSILLIQHQKQAKGHHLVYLFIDYKSPTISRNLFDKKIGKEKTIGVLILQVDTTFSLTSRRFGHLIFCDCGHFTLTKNSTGRTCIEMSRPVVGGRNPDFTARYSKKGKRFFVGVGGKGVGTHNILCSFTTAIQYCSSIGLKKTTNQSIFFFVFVFFCLWPLSIQTRSHVGCILCQPRKCV